MARRYRIISFTVSCRKISIIFNAGARYGLLSIEPMTFLALRTMCVVLILAAITLIARAC
jgi:lipoprotein signal peptidase